ncbi:MAG: biotin/lipoate A/B protein ligase family protein [Candidatus Diapherotrites archaeon]|nr:biotin/lipoate A/B protein ligase family protein [Candidatus Diapherotrites archaeon]
MTWRVVKLEEHSAELNMAIDEAVCEFVANGKSKATIRFYKWKPSAVSIGYFQSLEDEVDVRLCKDLGFDFVRRRTGGGAVYHDAKGEITYSVIAPEKIFPKGITESYHVICGWIVDSLNELGITAEFKPINDIITHGKKISGNAQTRRNGVLLQHGTILYDLDVETMFRLLKVPKEKISDKMISDVKQRVTSIRDIKGDSVSEMNVAAALEKGFTNGKEFEYGKWTKEELVRAHELVKERYSKQEWNFMR